MLRDGSGRDASERYRLVRPLGSGSYGRVHEAVDLRSGQRVAVKELRATNAHALARFKHEFRALADLHHPNLVGLKELIEEQERWLIVMELIEGTSFLEYVAPGTADNDNAPRFDEGRLRGALSGMAEGLRALHGFGVLHRDLKPSNVRVRPDGRAVLLDFGLATQVDSHRSLDGIVVGTVAYMAPEQGAGERVGPAADLYALGVCLFEALTGGLPFQEGSAIQILLDKQQRTAPLASSRVPFVPKDLDALCAALLDRAPEQRPTAEDVLARAVGTSAERPLGRSTEPPVRELFTGRESELDHLERALARTCEGELRLVLIEGESGVGKSELVRELSRRARSQNPALLALYGRCYENEQVAYNAFDGCIDELARYLAQLPEPERAALLPVRAALLGQLFPVLREVKSIDKAPREGSSADLTARRLEAFAALADLLRKLAEERTVVLTVDDLQWADAESFRLLGALMEQAARPPLLVLATIRPRDELEPEVRASVERLRRHQHTSVIELFGLPRAQARALAAELLGTGAPEAWLDMIAVESGGHPLFLSELVQYTRSHDFGSRGKLTLEAALRARIARLDRAARALLELVALAARPQGSHVFAAALGADSIDEPARTLLAEKLVKVRKDQALCCFHDRIRRAVTALVARAQLPLLHEQLAAALAGTPNADPSEQALHWDLAGQREHAIAAYELAAARAREGLAFDRAAQLCARALALCEGETGPRAERLSVLRAHALACAGHSAQAAALYRDAATGAEGEVRIRLRSRAAQQLMLSAKIAEGFELAREVLRELGVSLPLGIASALLRHAWDLAVLTLRRARTPKVDARRALVLEVVSELLYPISIVHPLAYFVLPMQLLRQADGAPDHTAIGHTMRGWYRALSGDLEGAEPLFALSRRLLAASTSPIHATSQIYLEGSARMVGFDFEGSARCFEVALSRLLEQCPEQPWLLTNTRYQLSLAWYHLGKHALLARESVGWLAEARERNDVLATALLTSTGRGFLRPLMQDDVDGALAQIEQTVAEVPVEPFAIVHFSEMMSTQIVLVYRGGRAALDWLKIYEAKYHDAFLMKTRACRDTLAIAQALASLRAVEGASERERPALCRTARAVSHALARRRSPYMRAYAALIASQLAAFRGHIDDARQRARAAGVLFASIHHHGHYFAAYLDGLLDESPIGRAKCERTWQFLESEGWQQPVRALTVFLPLLPVLRRTQQSARTPGSELLLDRYEVLERIGEGGFGRLVLARDVHSGQPLALEELVADDGASLERFKLVFRALSVLHHPNLARLDALFAHGGRWYIAMEHVEGDDLVAYVRKDGSCHLGRLRTAFSGLARGLRALHDAGFVHRDVTPGNVRVTREGRAVLHDFEHIARIGESAPLERETAYAAPEQRGGALPHQRADVYALGACLHQALYGQPPDARHEELDAELDDDDDRSQLSALCARTLADEPSARPTLRQVIDELASSPSRPGHPTTLLPTADVGPAIAGFVGRERELMLLRDAFERTCDVGFSVALVVGESGVGKSSLVAELAHRELAAYPMLQVLTSRCYESEQLAFKAFDGAVDQLARLLRTLPNPECEALLPKGATLLGQLFPVLTSVPAIALAAQKGLPADPAARRLAGRACLIALLERLSAQYELLLVIDDLQWADTESFELLAALTERAATLPFLCVCTVRPDALSPTASTQIARLRACASTHELSLSGLSDAATGELAERLAGTPLTPVQRALLVRESRGHPLFLHELIAHERTGTGDSPHTLDGALGARIATFDHDARTLLGLMALGGKPYGAHVYAHAMGRAELPREALSALLAHGLVQRRGGGELSCFHDRVRHVAATRLDVGERRMLAQRLAEALADEPHAEPAERARLWDEAGAAARAADAYEEAGQRALEGLSFSQAERHFARALALLPAEGEPEHAARVERLLIARGHALGSAGRSAEAARVYQRAAELSLGEQKVRLRLWAAQHLIKGAEVDEGLRAAAALLGELGLSLPKSDAAALVRIGIERARVRLRTHRRRARLAAPSPAERLILDALHGLSAPVRDVSFLPGSTLVAQYLRRALDAGDPVHAARALSYEALWRDVRAPSLEESALYRQSRALADAAGEPAAIAEVELVRGLACLARNQFTAAPQHLLLAHQLIEERCPGEPWLLTGARMYLGAAWFYGGDFASLARHGDGWMDEARARDDRYALAALAGFGAASLRHLLADAPERALDELDAALAPWPDEPFTNNHFGAFLATAHVLASEGPGVRLKTWLDARVRSFERAFLMRTPTCREALHTMRIWSQLLALDSPTTNQARVVLVHASAQLRAAESAHTRGAAAASCLYGGIIRAITGLHDEALRDFARAREHMGPRGWYLLDGAEYVEGLIEGGNGGREKCDAVLARIRAEGWTNPRRGLVMRTPGLHLLV